MKWSTPKSISKSLSCITGKKLGYNAAIYYDSKEEYFYFRCEKNGRVFDSLKEGLIYTTEQYCKQICDKWIELEYEEETDL